MKPIELHIVDGASSTGKADVIAEIANDASIAEVFQALTLPPDATIDGASVDSPTTTPAIDLLHRGSELSVRPVTSRIASPAAGFVDVAVVAGLDAGAVTRLGSGLFHLSVDQQEVAVTDTGWFVQVDDREPARCQPRPWQEHGADTEVIATDERGALAICGPIDPEPGASATVHRPPRPNDHLPPHVIQTGEVPAVAAEPSPLSWATLLAPIPIALLMAFFFRPIFALFAAMGPIMALGRWWESRRRYRRAVVTRRAAISKLRQQTKQQIAEQVEIEAQRRWLNNPPIGVLWQRADQRSVRVWERRCGQEGFMTATVGVGPSNHALAVAGQACADELTDLLHGPALLRSVPHVADLGSDQAIGVVGPRANTLAVARSLIVQLATSHGPADLRIGVLCTPDTAPAWDWLKWLPHLDPGLVAHNAAAIIANLPAPDHNAARRASTPNENDPNGVCLLIIDAVGADVPALVRASSDADLNLRFIVVAPDATGLPAVCSTQAHVGDRQLTLHGSVHTDPPTQVVPTGVSSATAEVWARQLAKLKDPELIQLERSGIGSVSLFDLTGMAERGDIAGRWAERPADAAAVATLGMGPSGPFQLDLSADGPHALIAGTTGSGKSELLRTMVVGLAAECPPEALNFVLVDFKGGGAFDVVHDLPHVVGVITDLDEALVGRALVSLRAELERRERLFRQLAVSTFDQAVRACDGAIARLVIVIDEFAALATDYAELMTGIIDLAARGRSLGMHLVLATQRPSGVVDQKIRANTNVRIALRVQDAFDSQDVVGTPDAAQIDRRSPGSSIVRIGGDRPVAVQMAFTGVLDTRHERCTVRPHVLFPDPEGTTASAAISMLDTELQVLVRAITDASSTRDAEVRPLWTPPLPAVLDWIDLGARQLGSPPAPDAYALGLADMPDKQVQVPWRWQPSTGGLCIYGASGPCAGKTLVSLGAAMASAKSSQELHLYLIDGGAGAVSALLALPHAGACIGSTETDRVQRVVALFETTLAARRSAPNSADAQLVLIIDNLASVLAAHDDMQASALTERLAALARDGFPLGVHLVLSARTPRDVTHRLAQQIPNRLVMELSDPSGFLALGLRLRDVPPLPSMRSIDVRSGDVVQLVEPPDCSGLACNSASDRVAPAIDSFPTTVQMEQLAPAYRDETGVLVIPIGIEAVELGHANLVLRPGEHALIVAAPGMGRSATVELIAHQLSRGHAPVTVVRIHAGRGPSDDYVAAIQDQAATERTTVVLVDDAHDLASPVTQALEELIEANNDHIHIVAATTPDAARGMRSWTARIRAGGTGILIGGAASDGEIFKVRLGPLDGRGSFPGRANLIGRGRISDIQLALANAVT